MGSVGSRRLKVLFFAPRFPYPMDTGGKIRTGKLLEYLNQVFDITLISNVESPKDDPYIAQSGKLCSEFYPVPWKERKKYSMGFYANVLLKSFSSYPVSVNNDYSPELEHTLLRVLEKHQYDAVVCDFLQPSINCHRVNGFPTILFQHNVEAVIPRRHFETSADPISKVFWWTQWRKMCKYEAAMCRRFDGVVAVSDSDKELREKEYGARRVFAIPTGVDTEYFAPRQESEEEGTLVFTGSMDWLPNEDAMRYFAGEILWRIRKEIPHVRVSIVGRNPSKKLVQELKQYAEVSVVGWVSDVRPYMSTHAVYIIPLRIGGGTRIKAFEALSMEKAMVSTSVGVEGLPLVHGEHLMLADTPEEFSQAVIRLLRDPLERKRLGGNAGSYVRERFGWEKIGKQFADICRHVVDCEREQRMQS